MIDTQVKTKSVTNTQLAVAVMAAFMAGGLAFAAAPAGNKIAAPKCGVNQKIFTQEVAGCPRGKASGIDYTCFDGKKFGFHPNKCLTQRELENQANAACANRCAGAPAPAPAPVRAVATGTLSIAMDTESAGFRYDRHILNGQKSLVGKVRLTVGPEEALTLSNLAFQVYGTEYLQAGADMGYRFVSDYFSSFELYKDAALSKLIATIPANESLNFNQLNIQLFQNQTQELYLAANINPLSTSTPTSSEFFIGATDATRAFGSQSFREVSERIVVTERHSIGVVPVKLTPAVSIMPNNMLLGGATRTLFAFQVTANGGNNVDANGDIIKAQLSRLAIGIETDIPRENLLGFELCRVESDACIGLDLSEQAPYRLTNNFRDNAIYLDSFNQNEDNVIDNGETAHFEIRGSVTPGADNFLQMRLLNVHQDFEYYIPTGYPSEFLIRGLRIDEPRWADYPNLIGTALVAP